MLPKSSLLFFRVFVLLLLISYAYSMAVNTTVANSTFKTAHSYSYSGSKSNNLSTDSDENDSSDTTSAETTDTSTTLTDTDDDTDAPSTTDQEAVEATVEIAVEEPEESEAETTTTTTTEAPTTEETTEETTTTTTTTTSTERVLTAEELRLTAILDDTNSTIQSTRLGLYKRKTQLSLNFLNTVISLLQSIHKNMTELISSSSNPTVSFANYKIADENIENQLSAVESQMDKNRDLLQKYMVAYKDTEEQLRTVHSTLGSILLPGFSQLTDTNDHGSG